MKDAIHCKVILFDLDGVLVDSQSAIEGHWHRWAESHGVPRERLLGATQGRRTIDTVRYLTPHLDAAAEAEAMEARQALDTRGVSRCDGAHEVLSALAPDTWAIVTSGTRALATARLTAVGLRPPRVLVTAEDVAHGKPSPEGYLRAAQSLAADPQDAIVIEDAPAGIMAGRAAGMRVIAVAASGLDPSAGDATRVVTSLLALRITRTAQGIQLDYA